MTTANILVVGITSALVACGVAILIGLLIRRRGNDE